MASRAAFLLLFNLLFFTLVSAQSPVGQPDFSSLFAAGQRVLAAQADYLRHPYSPSAMFKAVSAMADLAAQELQFLKSLGNVSGKKKLDDPRSVKTPQAFQVYKQHVAQLTCQFYKAVSAQGANGFPTKLPDMLQGVVSALGGKC